jgi:hypothetical protein
LVFNNENSCRGFGRDDLKMVLRRRPSTWTTCGGSLVACWWWSFFYLPFHTHQFSKVQFQCEFGFWIFQFTKSPSQLPKIRPIANFLSSKLLQWKLENPKISQLPKIHPKNHPKSNPVAKVQFPMSKYYPT